MTETLDRTARSPRSRPSGAFDALAAYRRMFNTASDGLSAWWYFGTAFVELEGFPSLPVIQAETLMIYRTSTLSEDAFRMDWWEIGYLRDPVTGEVAKTWTNPVTGAVVDAPDRFEEGPAHFMVSRAGEGLHLELTQAHAAVERVDVSFTEDGDRIWLEQTERKVRGFPLPDGTMPSLDSGDVSAARTTLCISAQRKDLAREDAASSGAYAFELSRPPGWMGLAGRPGVAVTRGVMVKAPLDSPINPIGWARLQSLFPDRFAGERIVPRWPA